MGLKTRFAAISIVTLLAVSLTACGSDDESPPSGDSSDGASGSGLKIAINHPMTPFGYWDTEACGAAKAAIEAGGSADRQAPSQVDTAEQVSILQAQALKNPDAYVINTIDADGMRQEIEKLTGQGKLVVTVAEETEIDGQVTNLIADQRNAGKLGLDVLAEAMGGSGKVLIVDYQKGVASTDLRTEGFKAALEDYPDIELVGVEYALESSKASDVVSASLVRDPDIKGVYTTNTIGADGAINALRAAGKTDSVFLVTQDGDEKAWDWVEDGSALAVIAQRPEALGRQAVEILERAEAGETFPEQIFLDEPFVAITAENKTENEDLIYGAGCDL